MQHLLLISVSLRESLRANCHNNRSQKLPQVPIRSLPLFCFFPPPRLVSQSDSSFLLYLSFRMTAIATLQYGLTVRATGLITAAHAWTSLEPIFQFFDLLSLRKKQDTLILKKKGSIRRTALTRIPEEIWVEIRKLITKERLKSAEEELFHVCMKSCPNDWCSCLSLTKYKWKAIVGRKNIPSCLENFFREFLEGRVKALKVSSLHSLFPF